MANAFVVVKTAYATGTVLDVWGPFKELADAEAYALALPQSSHHDYAALPLKKVIGRTELKRRKEASRA